MTPDANIASVIPRMAEDRPFAPAIFFPDGRSAAGRMRYTHYTYRQLDAESDVLAAGLEAAGIGRGVRAALLVKPSLEFFALTFAIFKAGAVPVLVDPGIGPKNVGACLAEAEPEAFIGIPAAHAARVVLGWGRKTVRRLVTVGPRWFWGGETMESLRARGAPRAAAGWRMARTAADEVAAVLFTSGSTGIPKGAVYLHGNFMAQVDSIRGLTGIRAGEIDLPTFPLFALFDPALGMTTVIPEMDFARPGAVNPDRIFEAIADFGCTSMFGSPALLDVVGRAGERGGVRLPTLRRVISAGASVRADIMQRFLAMLPEGALIHTPYGATESLPVASITSATVLGETQAMTARGRGVCVGHPVPEAEVRIIRISDAPIATWDDALCVPPGEVGEIVVKSPMVTPAYYGRADQTALAKIGDPGAPGGVRHRMGDLGYLDAAGRLWFCGRKSHRIETADGPLFTEPNEMVFNAVPGVRRTAAVGVGAPGRQEPVLVVEVEAGHPAAADRAALLGALRAAGEAVPSASRFSRVVFHPSFPVDIRHNAKIDRPALARWVEQGAR